MDPAISKVLAEFHKREARENELRTTMTLEEFLSHREEFLITIGPTVGQILNLLIRGGGARRILEVGTAFGYSTIWLAEAARANGGTVTSLELDAEKLAAARDALQRSGLIDYVTLLEGDAVESIAGLDGGIDFVLLDLWKELYIPCFDGLYPKLSPGALIAADNMLHPEHGLPDTKAYRAHIRTKPDIESVLLPLGSGVELSRYTKAVKV